MNIYLFNDFLNTGEIVLHKAVSALPPQRRKRNKELKTFRGRLENALAYFLLKHAVFTEKGIILDDNTEFVFNEKGKPYFKDLDIGFSLSHCAEGIICVLSDDKDGVGADIEKINGYNPKIAEKVCCTEEIDFLAKNEKTKAFYEMWTKKEAYSKMTGAGFSEGFKNINTLLSEKNNAMLFSFVLEKLVIGISVKKKINVEDFTIKEINADVLMSYIIM